MTTTRAPSCGRSADDEVDEAPPGGFGDRARGGWVLATVAAMLCIAPVAGASTCQDDCDAVYWACRTWAWLEFRRAIPLIGYPDAQRMYFQNQRACFANAKGCALDCDGRALMTPIKRILAIEAAADRWPAEREAYRRALLELAADLDRSETMPTGPGTLAALLEQTSSHFAAGGTSPVEAEARWAAWSEMLSDAAAMAEWLRTIASRLDGRPNLASMLAKRLRWRAGDFRASELRHGVPSPASPEELCASVDARRRVEARLTIEALERRFVDDESRAVLRGLAEGHSLADIGRAIGRNRQRVYRVLERMRAWADRGAVARAARRSSTRCCRSQSGSRGSRCRSSSTGPRLASHGPHFTCRGAR